MMALCAMSVSAQGIEFMPEGSLLQAAVDKAGLELRNLPASAS